MRTKTQGKFQRFIWRMRALDGDCYIVRRIDLFDEEAEEQLSFPRAEVAAWVRDPRQRPVLLEMYEAVYGSSVSNPVLTKPSWLEDRIEEAFRLGILVVIEEDELIPAGASGGGGGGGGAGGGGGGKPGSGTGPGGSPSSGGGGGTPPETKKDLTWFRARLVDEEGQPMAGEDYIVVDTTGAERKGKLDQNGEVYIPAILPPGNCTIRFPNIHLNPRKKK